MPLPLPPGLTHRPLTSDDAEATYAVIEADHRAALGHCAMTLDDLVADWSDPAHDVGAHAVGVFDGARCVAYAEHLGRDRADAAVHPDHHGRGVGTALAGWVRENARAAGATVVGQPVPEGSAADRLFAALGYAVRWTSWELGLPSGSAVADRPLPPGHAVRAATTEADRRAAWTVLEDAFAEWAGREREPWERFVARTVGRPDAEPWHLRVVTDPAGEVVGAVHVLRSGDDVEVPRVAVRRDRRGEGLAQALLAEAFATGRSHGARDCLLSTDSRTGALGLYLRIGMTVRATWVNRALDLATPGGNGDVSTSVASP